MENYFPLFRIGKKNLFPLIFESLHFLFSIKNEKNPKLLAPSLLLGTYFLGKFSSPPLLEFRERSHMMSSEGFLKSDTCAGLSMDSYTYSIRSPWFIGKKEVDQK